MLSRDCFCWGADHFDGLLFFSLVFFQKHYKRQILLIGQAALAAGSGYISAGGFNCLFRNG
jgi:hypothetical protein